MNLLHEKKGRTASSLSSQIPNWMELWRRVDQTVPQLYLICAVITYTTQLEEQRML